MEKISIIYTEAQHLLAAQPVMDKDEFGNAAKGDRYFAAEADYYLRAMLLVKEFEGVSGPLYLHLKDRRQHPSVQEAAYILSALVQHLSMFYKQHLP